MASWSRWYEATVLCCANSPKLLGSPWNMSLLESAGEGGAAFTISISAPDTIDLSAYRRGLWGSALEEPLWEDPRPRGLRGLMLLALVLR